MPIEETVIPFRPWRLKLSRLQAYDVKIYAKKYLKDQIIRFQSFYQKKKENHCKEDKDVVM